MAVVDAVFTPPTGRRAVLDRAHVGDVEGAFGTLSEAAIPPTRGVRARLAALAAVLGPGLVIMAAGNDAAGLGLLARAGEEHGTRLLWLLLALAPVVFVTQELVLRLGAVTGAGHARLIIERFGRRWGMFALADLLALNALTLVADFIAIALALGYFGIDHWLAAPIGAVALLGLMATGSFRGWERMMFVLLAATVAVVPLLLLVHADGHHAAATGGPASSTLVLVLALVGTTVAPWQLFVRQSNVVDKRITPRWLGYARVDTAIGTVVALLVAAAVLVACAWAFRATPHAFADAGGIAPALRADLSPAAGAIFAVLLIDAALLGAAAVALSSSYSVGDALGLRHSLHRRPREATTFHAVYAGFVVLGAAAVLVPGVPLGDLITGSQALAAVLLPSATVLLLLLGNDAEILGPWVNPTWLNVLGTVVVSAMLGLSTALVVRAVVPGPELVVGVGTATALLAAGLAAVAVEHARRPREEMTRAQRLVWTMPPLDRVAPLRGSRARRLVLVVLRVQIAVAACALLARATGLGDGPRQTARADPASGAAQHPAQVGERTGRDPEADNDERSAGMRTHFHLPAGTSAHGGLPGGGQPGLDRRHPPVAVRRRRRGHDRGRRDRRGRPRPRPPARSGRSDRPSGCLDRRAGVHLRRHRPEVVVVRLGRGARRPERHRPRRARVRHRARRARAQRDRSRPHARGRGVLGALSATVGRGGGAPRPIGRLPRVFRLYHRTKAGRPVRAAWILEEAGAPFEVVHLSMDETRADEHLERHPLGRVPVLEDDDGLLYESAAVCLQVADLVPEAGLIPPPGTHERGLVYQWVLYAMTEIEPAFVPLLPSRTTEPAAADAARALLRERLAVLERALEDGTYLVGDAFTVADVVVGSLAADIVALGHGEGFPAIAAWVARLEARPARERAVAAAGIAAVA